MNLILRTSQGVALVCAGLSAGVGFAHLLELPNKRLLSAQEYLFVQQRLYEGFGRVIGPIETVALLGTAVAAVLLRKRRAPFIVSLLALISFVAAQIIWQLHNGPVNQAVEAWTAATLPPDWTSYRDRWEVAHAVRAGLYTLGLGVLSFSVLLETRRKRNVSEEESNVTHPPRGVTS